MGIIRKGKTTFSNSKNSIFSFYHNIIGILVNLKNQL